MSTRNGAKTFRAEVVRSGGWWAIRVPAIEGTFSQARRLDQVEDMAREAIALMLDIDESEVGEVELAIQQPEEVANALIELQHFVDTADGAAALATTARTRTIKMLHELGYPMRDIGRLVGISHQRISQILAKE